VLTVDYPLVNTLRDRREHGAFPILHLPNLFCINCVACHPCLFGITSGLKISNKTYFISFFLHYIIGIVHSYAFVNTLFESVVGKSDFFPQMPKSTPDMRDNVESNGDSTCPRLYATTLESNANPVYNMLYFLTAEWYELAMILEEGVWKK
jgi:hypothetical protein